MRDNKKTNYDEKSLRVASSKGGKSAAQAVGVSKKSLHDGHKKFAPPPVPCGDEATVSEL